MRFLLAGGGTAGHVNPLLATGHVLREGGNEVIVLGTQEGLESDLVPAHGFPLETIEKVPLPRKPTPALMTLPLRLRRAVKRCEELLESVDVLVGFGGYVSTPAYFAARSRGVPVVIHEQNVRPGLANRLGAQWARVVALTFESTPLQARRGMTTVTGLPLRSAISELAQARRHPDQLQDRRFQAAARLGISSDMKTLLVTGGSLGAVHLNEVVTQAARFLPEDVQVIHLTGRGKDEAVRTAVQEAGVSSRWLVHDYLSTMEDALAVADLVLCRSGAGTVAEMTALGLPCVYVPLPIGNGEQRLNAADHVACGGALLVEDACVDADFVREEVFSLMLSDHLDQMKRASVNIGKTDAATRLADLVMGEAMARG
ncbi:undecaprenyldiphospho-muramoylpentapeptide beta-N-acetylglucosaminyltransferase [Schaalia sp. lx-260]|uniref:undecaprenyldiphospho-muramoylpentapeptide beta-N-acetylglucosaminyltransferase n=1 Tax=Schaalia sp. lx-260 TaxID=2899082 RepID=UPI001E53F147|nr:undecaprenyldiphospho-muramoylpentapeptide beta-N-acetylglucosaminyltransferase [Schaalia sp. lx-260]MCD4549243.1 undecaprenyldiphospho-muramoylpentapeptide beta-N-acetylglucosaminyltransferase [Schaalia sp. lx-260]